MTSKINTEMVLSALTDTAKTNTQIANDLGVARSSPKRHLDRLAQGGLAVKTPAGWIKGSVRKAQVEKPVVNDVALHLTPEQIIADAMVGVHIDDIKDAIEMHEHHLRCAIKNIVDYTLWDDENEKRAEKDEAIVEYDEVSGQLESAHINIKVIQYLKAALREA